MRRRWRCGPTIRSIASTRSPEGRCAQFMAMFPGKTAYAVKTNGEPMVLKTLARRASPLRRRLARRVRRRPRRRAQSRDALHASGQGAVRHPARAREIWHPRHRHRPRGRGDEAHPHRARARPRPGRDHPVRAHPDQGARRLRTVEEVRRGAGHAVELAAARPDRLQGRHLLSCRQPDRGSRHLRAGARLGRLGAEPHRRAARRPRRRRRLSGRIRPRSEQKASRCRRSGS